ncbi:MAG: polysaccharide deacetylase family protein [Acidimicrobiia bacterium]|jgi:peptidoglycan/xylan/chitin deacetylase (PgdA/CDA1 family)
MGRKWLVGLAALAVISVALVGPVGTAGAAARSRPGTVTVLVDGVRTKVSAARPTAARALTRAGVVPHDGVLRAAVSGTVIDPLYEHAYITVNGRPASMDTKLRRGWRVDVVNGTDAVEETATREVAVPYANQDKAGQPGWIAGSEGLASEVYGVVSGEVVTRTVLREPVAAIEFTRPADVGAGSAVFLTFDDGPDPTWTPQVLDVLRANGVQATFCMVGRYVAANPDLVRRVVAEGHALCNHTQNHARLDALAAAAVETEIGAASAAIEAAAGVRPSVFRIPYGRGSPTVSAVIAKVGMSNLGWTVDPSDYTRPGAAVIVARVAQAVRPGSIVLFHDGGGDRSQTVAAIAQLIPALKSAGYTFGRP